MQQQLRRRRKLEHRVNMLLTLGAIEGSSYKDKLSFEMKLVIMQTGEH